MFERLLALRNDVGLLAEEYDLRTQRQMGNFPQAFSHVALINTAYNLTRFAGPSEERAGREAAGEYVESAAISEPSTYAGSPPLVDGLALALATDRFPGVRRESIASVTPILSEQGSRRD
jgi:hypothetical protein